MVKPTQTTATRTVAITREGGRDDAIKAVRRLLGPTSTATAMTTPNTTNIPRMHFMVSTSTGQSTHTITETRLSSLPTVSRVTGTTAPIGMATPISQDLIRPGHQDICHATTRRPPFPMNYVSWFPSELRGKAVPLTESPYSSRLSE